MRPSDPPIGLEISRTGRLLRRAFDDQLAAAGGSLPVWLILTALKSGDHTMQREIADAIGIEGATLTHHLHRMEEGGLVTRQRDPVNRRQQHVALTDAGQDLFVHLLTTVAGFDEQLRAGFTDEELMLLRRMLTQLRAAASDP